MPNGTAVVIGMGPRGLAQLTLEGMDLVKGCDKVFGAAHQRDLEPLCRRLKVPFESLPWGGESPAGRGLSSEGALELILRSLRAGKRAGLVVDGNPALFSLGEGLRIRCQEEGIPCELRASVSSLDQALVALQSEVGDLAARGLAVYNAHSFIRGKAAPDRDLALFLYNAGGLRRDSPGDWPRLAARLKASYGRDGKVFLIECGPRRDTVVLSSLARLGRDLDKVGINATLCLPPAWFSGAGTTS